MSHPISKLKKWQLVVLVVLLITGLLWVLTPAFLKKAAIHQLPGIHDYQIFHNRTVETGPPQPWPESARSNQIRPNSNHLKDTKGKPVTYYGYQWWLMDHMQETIPYARGILGQYIYIIPSQNAVIVRLGHLRSDTRIGEHPTDAYTWVNMGRDILDQQ